MLSTQQQSESASLSLGGDSSSQQLGSQELGNRPKPGEPGWLVAIAENTGNTEKQEGISAKESMEMISASSGSEEADKVRRGESGWLVRLAGSEERTQQQHDSSEFFKQSQGEMTSSLPSQERTTQDSGKGTATITQRSRASNSQGSSQNSASKAFDLLGSEEVLSQVILYQEDVVKNSQQDSQENVNLEIETAVEQADITDCVAQGDDRSTDSTESPQVEELSPSAPCTISSSSQLSSMLDSIISDMKDKKSHAEPVSKPKPPNTEVDENVPSVDMLPVTQAENMDIPEDSSSNHDVDATETIPSSAQSSSSKTTVPSSVEPNEDSLPQPKPGQVSAASVPQVKKITHQAKPKAPTLPPPKKSKAPTLPPPKKSKAPTLPPPKKSKAPKKIAQKSKSKMWKTPGREGHVQRKGGEEMKMALMTLQKMRTACTWVMCSKEECGKWRFLPVKDPCLVEDKWECQDNPDQRYAECAAPEQSWDQGLKNKFVENRFTVGSLVWARMEGWPAWPGMVDDDPDTGEFFWTEVRGGEWVPKPSSYHVVFFDSKDKAVSRAWVADRKVERFVLGDKVKGPRSDRLVAAIEMARQAGREDLDTRRRKYCLATRFKGPWGPVWPFFGKESDNMDESDSDVGSDSETEEELCREVLEEVGRGGNINISLTHDMSISTVLADGGRKRSLAVTVAEDEDEGCVSKISRLGISLQKKRSSEKIRISPLKENVPPPMNLGQLYMDKSIYTQEMSHATLNPVSDIHQVSFQSDGGKEEMDSKNSSLDRGVDKAMQLLSNLTPIKQSKLQSPNISKIRQVLTPTNEKSLPPPSPASSRLPPSTPGSKASFQTSTPARKFLISPHSSSISSPVTKSLLSPGGDCHPPLNTTSGSTAFSADGSFMEL